MELVAGLILVIAFVILLAIGVPVSFSIAIASMITIMFFLSFDMSVFIAGQSMVTGIDSFSLLAIPFFIISGQLMNSGGISQRLVNFAKALAGRMPGSLLQTNIIGNLLFGSISGSAVASAVAMGAAIGPMQKKEGYDSKIAAAANISSASLGLILPPTGMFIIYSVLTGGTSIAALFLAGYIPGLMWAVGCMVIAYFFAKKYNMPVSERVTFNEGFKTFLDAIPSLLLIFIIIGGIVSGIFTATEASGIAVAYTFILSVFVYRTIKIKELPKIFVEAGITTSVVMFLVAASSVMSWVMAFTGIPTALSTFMLGISSNPVVLIIMINIVLLIVGLFMDLTPALLLFTPIFFPISQSIGMDPVHFGVMIVMNLTLSGLTPPLGSILVVGCSIADLEIEDVVKPIMPFFIMRLVGLMLVAFIPAISLFLPRLFGH